MTSTAAAQEDECPEGLVYDEAQDLCVLPEELDDSTDESLDESVEDDVADDPVEDDLTDEVDVTDVDDATDIADEEDVTDITDVEDAVDAEDQIDAVDEEADMEEDAVEEEPGYIAEFTLLHFACEPGFDPLQNKDNSEGLWHLCNGSGKPEFTYHLYVDQELVITFGMTTMDGGIASITLPAAQEEPIPAGYITLVVDPVPGYVSSYVTCFTDVRSRFDLEISNGTSVSFAADPDEAIECEWYHVPVDQAGGSEGTSFSVTKYACQGDFAPDPQEDPWSFYSSSCTETIAGQQFTLQRDSDGPSRQETGPDGKFSLFDIPVSNAGPPTWTVAERIPAGYGEPIVFCGPTGSAKQEMPLSNGNAITLAFENGVIEIACDWFNIPGESQPATISINARNCPEGTTAESDLATACTDVASNVPFALYSPDATLGESSTDDNGDVVFENVPPGELAVEEELPSGYGPVAVTCDHASTAFGQLQITPNILFGNGFEIEIDAGDTLDCAWYNLPALGADNGPNIAIQGYQCPPNTTFTADSTMDDLLAQCLTQAFDTTWEVLIGEELITSANSGGSGQVFFTKLPALQGGESYSLTMTTSQPSDEVLVAFCDRDNGDGLYEVMETPLQDGNRIDFALLDGSNMRCTWFYRLGIIVTPEPPQPGGAGELDVPAITVDVRFCPPEIETQRGDYEDLCPYPGPDVDLELTLDGEPVGTATSDETGRVQFPGSEEGGTYVLRHVPNPGFSLPAITCVRTTDGVASEPFYDALTEDTGFSFDLAAGETISCSWYILVNPDLYVPKEDVEEEAEPPAEGTSNVITVQFWVCPEMDLAAATQEELLLNCAPELEDRDLVVTVGDVTSGHHITGTETWGFLEPLFVLETGTDEAHSVWCSSTWTEDGEEMSEFPVAQEIVNGTLSLPVDNPGTTIFCDWFTYEPVADAGEAAEDLADLPAPDILLDFPGLGQGLEAFTIAQYGCLPAFDVTPPLPDPVPLSDLYCQGAGLTTIQYAVEINGAVYINTSLQNIGPSTAWSYPDPAALPAGATRIKAVTPAQFQVLQVDCTSGPGNSVRHDNLDISAEGWISFDTTPGSNVWCSFRVGPTTPWQGPQIKIKSYTCNQGFDLYTTDNVQRSNNCSLDTIPISFDVTLGGVGAGYVLYDGNDWGEMLFTPTQPGGTGTLRLTQPSVSGYGGMPRVYCTILAPSGATNLEPTMIDGVSIEIQAPNNSLVVCEWFRPLKTIG
jgi:hypothetical protein